MCEATFWRRGQNTRRSAPPMLLTQNIYIQQNNSNTDITSDRTDDLSFQSRFGNLTCAHHKDVICNGSHAIGFADPEVAELITICPNS
mmetsp:Transcript_13902/g.20573  ORF Transcript_13902/g.20573 Transcript_13902/m.20573 type:complete len:88 (-) Transcript_13902:15-278(-)